MPKNNPISKCANELNRNFSKEEVQMGNKYSLSHKGNANQTILRFHGPQSE
jgi:hypothetical protein